MSDWISESYMGRKAVARGKPGKRHALTLAKQGAFHYVYGPYAKPTLTIKPGAGRARAEVTSLQMKYCACA